MALGRKILKHARPRVYISGPITRGNRNFSLFQAHEAHHRLLTSGFAPLNPILTMICPFEPQVSHEHWLDCDFAWILAADMVLRLPGESTGGDMETAFAESIGVPVYTPETFPWNANGKDDQTTTYANAKLAA